MDYETYKNKASINKAHHVNVRNHDGLTKINQFLTFTHARTHTHIYIYMCV
jgi:hypothetical protein